jgi:3-hydroxybutyryl-CoA dehydrogenase
MEISKVGVVGCGLMGHGITQICAQAGWEVVVRELNQENLDRGVGKIEKQLARAVEKGKASQEDADAVRARIQPTLDYADLADCDLVIEAMTEDLGLKLEMWKEVDTVAKEDATFATNTSSLAVIDQAAATSRPDRFCGMHFFNPAQVMPLLEVVQTVTTSDETLKLAFEVGERLGKTTVHAKDKTGFIVNRLLVPYLLDAIRAYEEGVGSVDQIDAAIADIMFDEYRERRFAAPPTLRKMVAAGFYGRKSGKGFYDYSGEEPVPTELGL